VHILAHPFGKKGNVQKNGGVKGEEGSDTEAETAFESSDPSTRMLGRGSNADIGNAERSVRPRRQSVGLDAANKREVFPIAPSKYAIDHRLVVPFPPSDSPQSTDGFVDLNMYRKSKEEWSLLSQDLPVVARMVRTSARGLVKGASFLLYIGTQTFPSAHINQSMRNLHPVFYLSVDEGGEPIYTLSRKRGSNEMRIYEGKSEAVEDCRFTALIGDDRCIVKIIDLKALGFHMGGTVSDIHVNKFSRIASGADVSLIFSCYVLLEQITGKNYCCKWEGDVVANFERFAATGPPVADVASLLKVF